MKKNQLIPIRRFKEFVERWDKCKLGCLVNIKAGLPPGAFTMDVNKDGLLYVKVDDLNSSVREQKDSKSRVLDDKKAFKINKGSIIFPKRGAAIMTNKVRILQYDAYMDTNMMALEPNKISNEFLYVFILKTSLYEIADTSTIPQINNKHIEPYIIYTPSIKEQQKIGSFFKVLDERIANQERKIAKVKALKDAYLTEMFPQEGETVPKRRFKGFEDEWNRKLISEVMDVTSVKRIHQSDWKKEGVRFLRARDLVSFYKNEVVEDPIYISKKKYNEYTKASGKVNTGDLLVSGVGTIGIPYLIKSKEPVYFKDGNIIWFKNNNYLDGYYLYYYFTTKYLQNYIKIIAGIGTVGTYTINGGEHTPIYYPSGKEQQKIGEFFKNLDDQIATEEAKLDKLKQTKEAYLEEMFV